jgi:hypothetical protein|tara:strand:+ start:13694 stop:13894 length:201 start_codon:yes stop_codon:yes gene_type:complete
MSTKNDITGDKIQSRVSTSKYGDAWELIWGEEKKTSIRQKEPEDSEDLTEMDYCRRYSKTRSMGQD